MQKLKQRILLFLYKRKKEKEEKKKQKEAIRLWQMRNYGKYYSKPKVFSLTVLGLFVSLFEPKKKDIEKKSEIHLNKASTISILKEDNKKLTFLLKEVKEESETKEKKEKPAILIIQKEKLKQKIKETKNITKKYKKKEDSFLAKCIPLNAVLLEENIKLEDEIIKRAKKQIEKVEKILEEKKEKFENITLVKEEKKEKEQKTSVPLKTVKDPLFLQNNQKVDTILLSKGIEKIEEKIEKENDPSLLGDLLLELDFIEKKVPSKNLQKRVLNNKAEIIKKLDTQKKRKEKFTRTEEDLAEILLMETLILNQMKKQQKEIQKLRKKIESLDVVQKKKGFLTGIMQFLRKSIKLAFSLFPFAVFKNKKIGLLTSSILINNNIRSMRSAVTKVEIPYIEFEKVAARLRKSEEEVEAANLICYDSLEQISHLKKDFLKELGYETSYEVESIIKEMDKLESMIYSRTKELQNTKQEIEKVKKDTKQKVKKLESVCGKNG